MTCPGCKQPMIVLEIDGVEIDHCIGCGGVWLDGGELELLFDAAEGRDRLMAALAVKVAAGAGERALHCPLCKKKMVKVRYGGDKPVVLDKCPGGHGLWFDKGELYELIQLGSFEPDNRVFRLLNEVFGR